MMKQTFPGRRRVDPNGERGAVMVIFAVALPVLAIFVAFAIDVAHWFDYSRNLQNRADAAALAAGLEYGGTCAIANPSAAAMANIGQVAQNYAGAGPTSDLYYPYSAAATKNIPNLTAGTLDHYHVLINSQNYWQKGQSSATQSFTMGTPSTVCSSLDEDGKRGPFIDVKVTQDSLPLFFPLFGFKPTITAHARVSLEQGTFENNIRPLAVRDDSAIPCVSVKFVNAKTNTVIQTVALTKDATGDPNFPTGVLWDNPSGTTLSLPAAGANLADVYVQPFLNNCSGSGTTYDESTNSGLNWINVYDSQTPSNGQPPLITTGGVFLTGCSSLTGAYNQYFTGTNCQVGITANVAFAPNVPLANQSVTATDSAGTYTLTHVSGTTWHTDNGPTVAAGSGQHSFDIQAKQTAGTVPRNNGTQNCSNGQGCTTDLGIHQQAFGACNGCGDPNESGAIVALRLRYPNSPPPPNDNPQSSGRNVFAAGSSPKLVVEVVIQGLHFDAPGQKATVLRFGTSTDPATGLINCGQGSGASSDTDAITNGCPLYGQTNCQDTNFCAPMKIYNSALHANGICDPELRQTANKAYTDCVEATPGTRRSKIPGAIADRIIDNNNVCSPNHWPDYSANPTTYTFPVGDPRAITLIITSPADLSNNNVVPIRNFATFYVTGWDTKGAIPNCNPPAGQNGNEAFPGPGRENGGIWGHWIYYTDPDAGGSGTFCVPNTFGVCTPVLSR